jgi:nucleoside-diphosphate-sugar epimerase
MQHRAPSVDKIRAAIGWEPTVDLDRILEDVLDQVRDGTAELERPG